MTSIVPVAFPSPLTGNETWAATGLAANGQPSGTSFLVSSAQVAALASSETSFVSTNITTVGNGTLTAAAMIGDQIVRTGPSANFSDTTDTALNIIAAFPGGLPAGSNYLSIKNATAFTQTLVAGSGVTLPITVIIPPFSVGQYVVQPTSATAVTLLHISTNSITIGQNVTAPTIVSLATVGAGTIIAANFAGGLTARSGPVAAFTDTTDTATAIVAACANFVGKVGASFIYYYENTTNFVATLTGGIGVTVSGVTIVPPQTIAAYLVTQNAATPTIAMVGLGITQAVSTVLNIAGSSTGASSLQAPTTGGVLNTLPSATGVLAVASPAPVAAGSTLAVTAAMSGSPILLNTAAGSVATLPAATGSGNVFNFFVTTTATSNSHKILAASVSDFINGIVTGENAGTAKCFASAAATNHSLQMPVAGTQPSGGFIGDWFTITDVAANLWTVKGMYQAGVTPTTPFSAATT